MHFYGEKGMKIIHIQDLDNTGIIKYIEKRIEIIYN
jgi:hypothetical protein